MDNTLNKSRAEFEAWALKETDWAPAAFMLDADGEYKDDDVHGQWLAWCAALARAGMAAPTLCPSCEAEPARNGGACGVCFWKGAAPTAAVDGGCLESGVKWVPETAPPAVCGCTQGQCCPTCDPDVYAASAQPKCIPCGGSGRTLSPSGDRSFSCSHCNGLGKEPAQPTACISIGITVPGGATVLVIQRMPDGTNKVLAQHEWPADNADRTIIFEVKP